MKEFKICSNKYCKKEKSVSDFYKNKKLKDGYQCWCKDCMKLSLNNWKNNTSNNVINNKDYNKNFMKNWYKKNLIEHKKNVVEYNRKRTKEDCLFFIRQTFNNYLNAYRRLYNDKSDLGYTLDQFVEHFSNQAKEIWNKGLKPRIIKINKYKKETIISKVYALDNLKIIEGSKINVNE